MPGSAAGSSYFARGRYAEAIDDLDRAAALDPRNAVVHKYRALACDKVGRLREAALSRQAYVHCEAPARTPGSGGGSAARQRTQGPGPGVGRQRGAHHERN